MSLDWPAHIERTPASERRSTSQFKATRGDTNDFIRDEMRLMGASEWRVETGSGGAYTHPDGLPKSKANPDDPSVVLRFIRSDEQHGVGVDHFTQLSDNLRELALWLRETRKSDDRHVGTARSTYAQAALPSGDDAPTTVSRDESARDVLGVEPGASESEITDAFRDRVSEVHPDLPGGDETEFKRAKSARDQLLE